MAILTRSEARDKLRWLERTGQRSVAADHLRKQLGLPGIGKALGCHGCAGSFESVKALEAHEYAAGHGFFRDLKRSS
jgi:hypothetical protein